MPKRLENQETELELYYWTGGKLDDLVGGKNNSRKFVKILEEFQSKKAQEKYKSDMKKLFKKYAPPLGQKQNSEQQGDSAQDGNSNQQENLEKEDKQSNKEKQKTGGRYLLQKCLECHIISSLSKEEKQQLQTEFDRERLEEVLEEKGNWKKEILPEEVTDDALEELVKRKCCLNKKEEGVQEPCDLYETGQCAPQLLLELFETYQKCRGKGEPVYSSKELREMCRHICMLLPLGGDEEEFNAEKKLKAREKKEAEKKEVEKEEPKKEEPKKNSVTSVIALRRGIPRGKTDLVNVEEKAEIVRKNFDFYYIEQCMDKERAKRFFVKLTKGWGRILDNYVKEETYSEICSQKTDLYEPIIAWKKRWIYVIERYASIRKMEEKIKQGEKETLKENEIKKSIRMEKEDILDQIIWEYTYKKQVLTPEEQKIKENREKFWEVDIKEEELSEIKQWQEKASKEIEEVAEKLCGLSKAKINRKNVVEEREQEWLCRLAFEDLERLVEAMELEGLRKKGKSYIKGSSYTKKIIKSALEFKRGKNMCSPQNDETQDSQMQSGQVQSDRVQSDPA